MTYTIQHMMALQTSAPCDLHRSAHDDFAGISTLLLGIGHRLVQENAPEL